MEFSNLNLTAHADRGAVLQVRHPVFPDKLLEGVSVRVVGNDSTIRKNRLSEVKRRAANDPKSITTESIIDEHFESTVESILSWEGIEEDGKAIECTRENVKYILKKYDWLKIQIDNFIADRRNFFLTSEESSN